MKDYLSGVLHIPDTDHGSRRGRDIEGSIIHATRGGSGRRTAEWAAKRDMGRSWHVMGPRSGPYIQQVPLTRAAWHAGDSEWWYRKEMTGNPNLFTVGIELANWLDVRRSKDGYVYEIHGRLYDYKGEEPVEAELSWDNGDSLIGFWEPYTEEQLDNLDLVLDQLERLGVPRVLIGHEEIQMPFGLPGKKRDPGPLFPWDRFGRPANVRRTEGIIL